MSLPNDQMNEALKTANLQSADQIEEALKLLTNALNTLKGTSQEEPTNEANAQEASNSTSPIMKAMQSSTIGAHEAMKAAENGVKTAIENAEKHMQEAIGAFPQPTPPNIQAPDVK